MPHNRYNLKQLEKPNFIETDEGFLQIKGNILKADSFMEYRNKTGVLREKIPKDILFSDDVKNSFLHKKVTLEHPSTSGKLSMINSENVAEFGKGTIIDVFENGDCLGAILQVEDENAVNFIKDRHNKNENIELSAGYTAETELIKGNEYIQKNIIANHVAILAGKGRAGSDVRLIYNYLDYEEEKGMTLKFNGEDLTSEELLAKAINLQNENENLKEKFNGLELEKKALFDEKATLETEKQTLITENSKLEAKYNELVTETENKEIISKAKEVLNSVDEKEKIEKIMEKVIKEVNPKFNMRENATVNDLKDTFNFSVETLSEMDKEAKLSERSKFNNQNEAGLTLNIDNGYFSKKRTGGN
jgi:hypothetical protein